VEKELAGAVQVWSISLPGHGVFAAGNPEERLWPAGLVQEENRGCDLNRTLATRADDGQRIGEEEALECLKVGAGELHGQAGDVEEEGKAAPQRGTVGVEHGCFHRAPATEAIVVHVEHLGGFGHLPIACSASAARKIIYLDGAI